MIIETLTPQEQEADAIRIKILAALADPTRLQTIRIMQRAGHELPCEELRKGINLSTSTFSYHGKILFEANLTTARKIGREKYVSLNRTTFDTYLPGFLDTL